MKTYEIFILVILLLLIIVILYTFINLKSWIIKRKRKQEIILDKDRETNTFDMNRVGKILFMDGDKTADNFKKKNDEMFKGINPYANITFNNSPKYKTNENMNSTSKPNEPTESEQVKCPKCNSSQITANKRGFKLGRAIGVGIVTGGVGGVIAGAVGKNKVMITCLKCGHTWKAGS